MYNKTFDGEQAEHVIDTPFRSALDVVVIERKMLKWQPHSNANKGMQMKQISIHVGGNFYDIYFVLWDS